MTTAVKLRGLPDLDRPLYRIFPLWFFEDALRVNGGRLVLVRPQVWEDPFEHVYASIQMQGPNGQQKQLVEYLQPAYAQCWSLEGDSDALLRAYSRVTKDAATQRNVEPRYEGVKVRTTPRKIIQAVELWLAKKPSLGWSFYPAAIEYRDDFLQRFANRLAKIGPVELGQGDDRVDSLLFKRPAFRHESEVRLICLADSKTNSEIVSVDVDPNQLFDEIQFDPRLASFERKERERLARSLGYTGPIKEDGRYHKTFFLVPLSKPWFE
jgi:hypothetical protein